jgi:membrane protein DedA with SNARE-associated domain
MKTTFLRLWGAAIAVGLLTLIGLVSALIGDGPWDVLSAITLGVPVGMGIWYGWMKKVGPRDVNTKKHHK